MKKIQFGCAFRRCFENPLLCFGVLISGLATITACNSSKESSTVDAEVNAPLIEQFSEGSSTFADFLESDAARAIADSFPSPELPSQEKPFNTEPNQRFEQWTLSAMTEDEATGDWQWTEQQFFRLAVVPANAETGPSSWGFRDVMAQRFTTYNFRTAESQSISSAERRAMQLSDVNEGSVYVHDTVATINSTGCNSSISLNRTDTPQVWIADKCPVRIQLGDTIFSTAQSVFSNGVGWMSHAYGQLPNGGGGAVMIDQLEVTLEDKSELSVNRSRRRSGTGPITVAGSLTLNGETRALDDAQWLDHYDGDAVFPSGIQINVPSLALALDVEVPKTLPTDLLGTGYGLRHGVLITIEKSVLPGVITLQPRTKDAL